MLIIIPPAKITEELVDKIVDKLDAASPAFDGDPDLYKERLLDGTYLLWGHENAVLIGKVTLPYSKVKTLELDTVCLWGRYKGDFNKALDQIEIEAKQSGIDRIVIKGREGWRKIHDGYSHYCTTIFKEL